MKISRENYKEVLDQAMMKMDLIPTSQINEIQLQIDRLKNEIKESRKNADNLLRDNSILKIGIVGQVKAGKSSFLNSLIFNGENVLPKAATPMTAGLTILEYAETNQFEVEYYNQAEWDTFVSKAKELEKAYSDFKNQDPTITLEQVGQELGQDYLAAKELIDNCSGKAKNCIAKESKKHIENFTTVEDMQLILNNFVGANGSFTPVVKCLTIRLHDERLKDMQIVDTPGVNDPVVSREERTKFFLNECHGVFLLSYSGRFFDKTDVDFLVNRIGGNGIGSVVVIASKYDSVLQDAGSKYHDDLGGAAEYCYKSLQKQLISNIANSDYKGSIPAFDYSSGIGYSIYKKPEAKWDATESHVVAQMKRFYPSFFTNIDEIKQTFYDLSQIDEIQNEYLNKIFSVNKEAVIQSKLENYFTSLTQNLINSVDKSIKEVGCHLQRLEEGKGSDLSNKKKASESLMKNLTSGINKCSKEIEIILKNGLKKLQNSLTLTNLTLPKESYLFEGIRKSNFWGRDKKFTCNIEKVNKQRTYSESKKALTQELEKLNQKWDNLVGEALNVIRVQLREIVDNYEQNDTDGINIADSLRDIIDDVVLSFQENQVLEYKSLLRENDNSLADIVQNFEEVGLYLGESCKEIEAKDIVKNKATRFINAAQSSFNRWKENAEDEISRKLDSDTKKVLHELDTNRNKMIEEISNRFGMFIDQMNVELQNFEVNKKHYEESLKNLELIRNLI